MSGIKSSGKHCNLAHSLGVRNLFLGPIIDVCTIATNAGKYEFTFTLIPDGRN